MYSKNHVIKKDKMKTIYTKIFHKISQQLTKIPPSLRGLAAEAIKYKTFEEFQNAYLGQIKHGTYWHLTDNPNFQIDPLKGPRDMSSMSGGQIDIGHLMITSHLEYWHAGYNLSGHGTTRPYAAQIDMSQVDSKDYYQVNRGFGNEFIVTNPSKAKVIRVLPIKNAIRINRRIHDMIPDSEEKLKEFYNFVHNKQMDQEGVEPLNN